MIVKKKNDSFSRIDFITKKRKKFINYILIEGTTRGDVTFLRNIDARFPNVEHDRETRLSLKTFPERLEPFRSHEQTAVRTVGTVSGANVIGTLCDIVTREYISTISGFH